MIRPTALLAVLLALCGCDKPTHNDQSVVKASTNPAWRVLRLGKIDGCMMYDAEKNTYDNFFDHEFYFVRCGNNVRTEESVEIHHGKSTTTEEHYVDTEGQ